jgi:hypothetical protein
VNQDLHDVVQAIESLKQESNLFKDYLYPIVSSFFSAILGAIVAYYTLRFQEGIQRERTKLDICNKWSIEVEGLFQSLIAFKGNYISDIGNDPVERAVKVRTILNHNQPIQINYAELSFITPSKNDIDGQGRKWQQLSRIRGMIENYNAILALWNKRNSSERPLKEKIISALGNKPYADVTEEEIINVIGEKDLTSLIDLTEKALHLTDDIIIESNDFLNHFPDVVKAVVNIKKIKKYGTVLKFNTSDNQYLKKLIKRSPEVNYEKLARIYGITFEEAKKIYHFGYPCT